MAALDGKTQCPAFGHRGPPDRLLYIFANVEEMPKHVLLGDLELMVLLALVRLGDEAYGVPISRELFNLAGREVALGSVYAALDRLKQKEFVTSILGDPTPERGGLRALKQTCTALIKLWNGIPQLEGKRI